MKAFASLALPPLTLNPQTLIARTFSSENLVRLYLDIIKAREIRAKTLPNSATDNAYPDWHIALA
jgi:hypothetical protein